MTDPPNPAPKPSAAVVTERRMLAIPDIALDCAAWHDAEAALAGEYSEAAVDRHVKMAAALRRVAERLAAGCQPGVR